MSTPNQLTNVAVSASGEVPSLLIEKFNGKVNEQYLKGENIMAYFDVQTVTNTNTVSNKYLGDTDVQVLAPGQSPAATPTQADKNQLVIDTTVIARNTVAMLHDVQGDINGLHSKLSANQVKQLKKLEDEMLVQQLILGGIYNAQTGKTIDGAGRSKPRVKGHGYSINVQVTESEAEDNPDYVMAAIEYALEQQLEQEVDVSDVAILMPWKWFNCLRDADRIVDKTYTISQSGATINGYTLSSYGCPVVPSNRFPKFTQGAAHHKLSNEDNGYRYDTTAEMNGAIAVLFTADALLVGRTISLTGDIFWTKKEKTYYIDTWMAEGAIPDRWEAVSVVTTKRDASSGAAASGGKDAATVLKRAKRKAQFVREYSAAAGASVAEARGVAGVDAASLVEAVRAIMAADIKPTAMVKKAEEAK